MKPMNPIYNPSYFNKVACELHQPHPKKENSRQSAGW